MDVLWKEFLFSLPGIDFLTVQYSPVRSLVVAIPIALCQQLSNTSSLSTYLVHENALLE